MTKSILRHACVGLLALLIAGVPAQLQAQEKKKEKNEAAPASEASARPVPFRGKIAAVDQESKSITLAESTKRTIAIGASTKITKDGKSAALADAAPGDEVGGSYRKGADGKLEAVSLRIGPKPEGQPKGKKKEVGS